MGTLHGDLGGGGRARRRRQLQVQSEKSLEKAWVRMFQFQ